MGYMGHVPFVHNSKMPGALVFLNYSKRVIYGSVIPKCIETELMYLVMCVSYGKIEQYQRSDS